MKLLLRWAPQIDESSVVVVVVGIYVLKATIYNWLETKYVVVTIRGGIFRSQKKPTSNTCTNMHQR